MDGSLDLEVQDGEEEWTTLIRRIAAAADLCLKPHCHSVVPSPEAPPPAEDPSEWCLRLQPRNRDGERLPEEDLDLEIYHSGGDLNLMLSWPKKPERPMLWHGAHPVWMDGVSGLRCERPSLGAALESLARRIRALMQP
jgi:hypothetical protein